MGGDTIVSVVMPNIGKSYLTKLGVRDLMRGQGLE